MTDEKKKEIAIGVASTALAVATVAAAPAVAAVATIAAPVVAVGVGLGFIKVRDRDEKRAQRLIERMISEDETPVEFAEHLRAELDAEDSEFTSAFRHLLITTVEAATPSAIGPMAVLGRRYLRSLCPPWLARGGLRVLAECTEPELADLRDMLPHVASYPQLRPIPRKGLARVGIYVTSSEMREVRTADPALRLGPAPKDHRRLFRLLKVHGLAEAATDAPDGVSTIDTIAIEILVAVELATALQQGGETSR